MTWSVIMSYKPNFNDPRVIKKIKTAVGFVGACFSSTKPHQWSTRYMDKFFGQQQHDLSKWLRNELVICTNERYTMGTNHCKEYIKNQTGYDNLICSLRQSTSYPSVSQVGTIVTDWVKDEYKTELETKNFKYDDKSSRLWHPLQRVRKEHKMVVFSDSGLKYQYDIECCAPTLIHQYSQMLDDPMDLYLPALTSYIKDRKTIREQIASEAEIPPEIAKEIISALVNGAQLGMNYKSDIYKVLKGDKARIEYLKQNEYIQDLRNDMKVCWSYIKQTLPVITHTDKNGRIRTRPISSKQKAGVYFDLERVVLNSVIEYLKSTNNQYFLEHDGWVCTNEINVNELVKWVKVNTGYDINLDWSVI